jgi:hypothetical protein
MNFVHRDAPIAAASTGEHLALSRQAAGGDAATAGNQRKERRHVR